MSVPENHMNAAKRGMRERLGNPQTAAEWASALNAEAARRSTDQPLGIPHIVNPLPFEVPHQESNHTPPPDRPPLSSHATSTIMVLLDQIDSTVEEIRSLLGAL